MVTWIVVGVVALGLAVLAGSLFALAGRLRGLESAGQKARRQAEQAEKLTTNIATLQSRAEELVAALEPIAQRSGDKTG